MLNSKLEDLAKTGSKIPNSCESTMSPRTWMKKKHPLDQIFCCYLSTFPCDWCITRSFAPDSRSTNFLIRNYNDKINYLPNLTIHYRDTADSLMRRHYFTKLTTSGSGLHRCHPLIQIKIITMAYDISYQWSVQLVRIIDLELNTANTLMMFCNLMIEYLSSKIKPKVCSVDIPQMSF